MTTPWWKERTYRDPAYRYAELEHARVEQYLRFRHFRLRNEHPLVILGASLAIAGAAAVSRMTQFSLDRSFRLLEMYGGGW